MVATGPDAEDAVKQLQAAIADGLGEETVAVTDIPAAEKAPVKQESVSKSDAVMTQFVYRRLRFTWAWGWQSHTDAA